MTVLTEIATRRIIEEENYEDALNFIQDIDNRNNIHLRQWVYDNSNISLEDKIRRGVIKKVTVSTILECPQVRSSYSSTKGKNKRPIYHILDFGMTDYQEITLSDEGFGGSVLLRTIDKHSANLILSTGQIDIFLLHFLNNDEIFREGLETYRQKRGKSPYVGQKGLLANNLSLEDVKKYLSD